MKKKNREIPLPEEEVYYNDLDSAIRVAIEPISLFAREMLNTDDRYDHIRVILDALIEQALRRIDEKIGFLYEQVGGIRFVEAKSDNSKNIPAEALLGVKIEDMPRLNPELLRGSAKP